MDSFFQQRFSIKGHGNRHVDSENQSRSANGTVGSTGNCRVGIGFHAPQRPAPQTRYPLRQNGPMAIREANP